MERIIKRAEVTPWPKLFHNLKSTRQSELTERFPSHVVCAWLGNSRAVAQDHYLQVTDSHFAQAAAGGEHRLGQQQAAHNPAHSTSIPIGNDRQSANPTNENRPELPSDTPPSRYLHNSPMTPTAYVYHDIMVPSRTRSIFNGSFVIVSLCRDAGYGGLFVGKVKVQHPIVRPDLEAERQADEL